MELSGSGLSISAKRIKPSSTSRRTNYVASSKKPARTTLSNNNNNTSAAKNRTTGSTQAAKKMYRAKTWSPIVEEHFRFQQCGWKDLREYESVHGTPDRWEEGNGPLKCTKVKSSGFFKYWSRDRECEDKYLNQVKVFEY